MSGLSNFSEDLLLIFLLTGSSIAARPTAWYMALHTEEPDDDGVGGELAGGAEFPSYARQVITFSDPVADTGQALSSNTPTWTCDGTGFTVTHVSIWDAVSGGNCLFSGPMLVSRTIGAAGVLTFSPGYVIGKLV